MIILNYHLNIPMSKKNQRKQLINQVSFDLGIHDKLTTTPSTLSGDNHKELLLLELL